jgi:cyanophycin synthetase
MPHGQLRPGTTRRSVARVIEKTVYRGPHLYSETPMIRIRLDLGELENWPSNRISGFAETLIARLPSLSNHHCSLGHENGFVERLREGTWLGHVAEHVALELQSLAGHSVTRGKTRAVKGHAGVYDVMFAYVGETVGLLAGRLALELVDTLLPEDLRGVSGLGILSDEVTSPLDLGQALDRLRSVVRRDALGPTTSSLVREAERRGIPVTRLADLSFLQLGYGRHQQRIWASITGRTSHAAVEAACDKDLTKTLLRRMGLPVPRGALVGTAEEAIGEARRIGFPVAVKPLDGNHGRAVSLWLRDPQQVSAAFEEAARVSGKVIVEEQIVGNDYRILVVDGAIAAVAERVPAQVVGDGRHTVRELIDVVNRDPRRGEGHEQTLTKITVDEHVLGLLADSKLSLDCVPAPGEAVRLRATANISTGGTAVDRTDEIHPDNALIARRAAAVLGLDIAGIDFLAPCIARSVRETGGGIVEVNAAPGFRMHLEPSEGKARNVARPVIDMLFPKGKPARIPIIAVTGTNGKSTTCRMLAQIYEETGSTVGLTTSTGIYIGGHQIDKCDASGPKSARLVLGDPSVDVAVLETARGGILREGLGFDRCDVGVVLNIESDHLGLKGIDTLDDLANVKSVVVEAVSRDGVSVLNADDPRTAALAEHAGGRLAYFSVQGPQHRPAPLAAHLERGGLAVVAEPGPSGGHIFVCEHGEREPLMAAATIPATLGGLAEFNVQNALAAIAAAVGQGVPLAAIRSALSKFGTDFETCPGRLNLRRINGANVILDYVHNPAGLRAVGKVVRGLRGVTSLACGLIAIPGDRRDEDIREMGALAAETFDRVLFYEDEPRGRPPGETIELMIEAAAAAGTGCQVSAVASEVEAVDHLLSRATAGDVVLFGASDIDAVWQRLCSVEKGPVLKPAPMLKEAVSPHV